MNGTRVSVLVAHLALGLVLAVPEIDVTKRALLAAKRLSLRSSDPLTRRSPDAHFMRFGRSDSDGDGGAASKAHVKREAYGLAADDASPSRHSTALPTPSLTCVPDVDSNGRVVCYAPFNVSRHFLLVTESDGRRPTSHGDGEDEVGEYEEPHEEEEEADDDDAENDGYASVGVGEDADGEKPTDDDNVDDDDDEDDEAGGGGDSSRERRNDTRKRSAGRWTRTRDKIRLGRSTATAAADDADVFARFGRRRDNFMRLGRDHISGNRSPLHGAAGAGSPDTNDDYGVVSGDDKRGSRNFLRFGRERAKSGAQRSRDGTQQGPRGQGGDDRVAQNGQPLPDDDDDEHFSHRGRKADAFARPARGPGDMNQLRLGRSGGDRLDSRTARRDSNFMRLGRADDAADSSPFGRSARRHDNFMRLGRGGGGGGGGDLDMFRETRRRDSFLRLGRASDAGGGSRICGLAADGLTPRLIRHLLSDRRAAVNRSTGPQDGVDRVADTGYEDEGRFAAGPGAARADSDNAYYDSMVECLRRYVRQTGPTHRADQRAARASGGAQFRIGERGPFVATASLA